MRRRPVYSAETIWDIYWATPCKWWNIMRTIHASGTLSVVSTVPLGLATQRVDRFISTSTI